MSLKRIEAFAELLYEEKICDDYDRIIPVVGGESSGKSTFILQFMVIWRRITGREVDAQDIIDQMIYSREGFQNAMADYPARTVVPVPDAARAMHRKEAMDPEQVETEKDLLDVRAKEHVILLGYQDWDIIPDFLQRRRAGNVIYIPTRGTIWGYNRDGVDDRYESDEWPEPQMTASFPSLEGTDLWREYRREDLKRKQERIRASAESGGASDQSPQELAEAIKSDGIDSVVGVHGGWNKPYLDPDLIEMQYDVSARKAKKVKKLLEADPEVSVPDSV